MFWKAVTVVALLVFAASEANGQIIDVDRIRNFEHEVGDYLEINGRTFDLNRVGRGKLGSKIMSGNNYDGESITIVQSEDGQFAGNVLMDGKNFRVMPDGTLRRAGKPKGNDGIVRDEQFFAYDRITAGDGDVGIVDRWHNPGWQNMITDAKGNYYGFWGYTSEDNRTITYIDVYAYVDNRIPNHKSFLDAEIALANTIFQRSKVYIRLNLVGYEGVNLPMEKATQTLTDMSEGIGVFRNINSRRLSVGADLVYTFASTDTRRDMCGVSFIGGYKGRWNARDGMGVSVCHGGETFVHEVAHNFGSDHDEANAGEGFHFWYSLGFNKRDQAGWDTVSTVMSYGDAEVGVFSNPDLFCKGDRCGREEVSDNARSLNEVRRWVAAYAGPGSCQTNCGEQGPSTNDKDNDGITDPYDACPNTPIGTQVDTSGCPVYNGDGTDDSNDDCGDGFGQTPCDDNNDDGNNDDNNDNNTGPVDSDGDGVSDSSDNCPNNYNPSQSDNDRDGLGNPCDNTPNGDPTPTMSALIDVTSHGGICERSRSTNRDYKTTFRGFENASTSGSVWAVCPITRANNSRMVAAEITVLPITDNAGNYNIQCDLVEIYEGNVEETISLRVNPNQTNTGESTHVFDPVVAKNRYSSSFAVECQVPRGYAITNVRQVSGNN